MAHGGNRKSREVVLAARERERQVIQLYIRGATFAQIAHQLGLGGESGARMAWNRALKRLPAADVEAMRKLSEERIQQMRQKIWSEMAGRRDPNDPNRTIPSDIPITELVDRAVRIDRHEAMLFGLDGPSKSQVVSAAVGQPISDEELDQGLARLTEQERETFMMLLQKLQGRWVEPPPSSIETTASVVTTASESEPSKSGPEAEPQPVHGNQCDAPQARQQASSDGSGKSASNGDFAQRPASRPDIQLCPRCGRCPRPDEGPIYNNGVPMWHQNCRPLVVD